MAKTKKDRKLSSGLKKMRAARREIRRSSSKIKRWKRYQSEIDQQTRTGNKDRWDTSRLEKYIVNLTSIIREGKK